MKLEVIRHLLFHLVLTSLIVSNNCFRPHCFHLLVPCICNSLTVLAETHQLSANLIKEVKGK